MVIGRGYVYGPGGINLNNVPSISSAVDTGNFADDDTERYCTRDPDANDSYTREKSVL